METLYTSVPLEVFGLICLLGGIYYLIKENMYKKFDSWTRIGLGIVLLLTGMLGLTFHNYPKVSSLLIFIIPTLFIPLLITTLIFRFKNRHNKY